MSEAILFYSYSGTTRRWAEKHASETGADLFEVKPMKPYRFFSAILPGCPQAARGKEVPVIVPDADLAAYDALTVAGPIWAGHPAPPLNSIIALLPEGKNVTLVILSGRGDYDPVRAKKQIAERGCRLAGLVNVEHRDV